MTRIRRLTVHVWRIVRRPTLAFALAAVALLATASDVLASPLAQGGADIGSNQVIVAIMSLLGVGVVGSTVTAFLRKSAMLADTDPKTILYVVCAILSIVVQATVELPTFTGDPGLFWADVLLFVQTAKTGAEVLYNLGLEKLLPDPA